MEETKAGKGEDQGGLGKRKCRKQGEKGTKEAGNVKTVACQYTCLVMPSA